MVGSMPDTPTTHQTQSFPGTLLIFAGSLFLSASLLFSVQPFFARLVLPLLGGSPSVWNTSLVFFQTALLAGYAYAHLSCRWLSPGKQILLHAALFALAFSTLPFSLSPDLAPAAGANPSLWLLGALAAAVGPSFFVLAATAPLLQAWFSRTGHPQAKDPYFLYSASNAGSMAGLLGYPLLAEPFLRLAEQNRLWMAGYIALGGLVLLAGVVSFLARKPAQDVIEDAAGQPPSWSQRLIWMALAALPSSLLLGVTNHITTDIAAVPLLWVGPLALYLLSFILVFARRPLLSTAFWLKAQPGFLIALMLLYFATNPQWIVLPLHLLAFFLTAMACHGQLAERRPSASHLTGFYLWMSLGGALGGALTALLAPLLFNRIAEYPIALVLACLLRPWPKEGQRITRNDVLFPVLLAACLLVLHEMDFNFAKSAVASKIAFYLPLGILLYVFSRRPLRFALGAGVSFFILHGLPDNPGYAKLLHERSFFGVYRVMEDRQGDLHVLKHGTTIHGAQFTQPEWRQIPLTYFGPRSPLGQVFNALRLRTDIQEIGAVGLGSGAAVCHPPHGRRWTIFEIDPLVERIARDPRLFTYLSECAPDARIVIGDARLSLKSTQDGAFDLLILDAFSSDSIPVHLMTVEAVELYAAKLAQGGLLVWHISNRNLELAGIAANALARAGFKALIQSHSPDALEAIEEMSFQSTWIVAAKEPGNLDFLEGDRRWQALPARQGAPTWTDDFSNIASILKF